MTNGRINKKKTALTTATEFMHVTLALTLNLNGLRLVNIINVTGLT